MFNQTHQRAARVEILADISEALCKTFPDKYPEGMFLPTVEGNAFQLPQDPNGDTFGVICVKVKKDPEYDITDANEEYLEKEAIRKEKAEKARIAKEKKMKRDEEIRAEKARKKAEAEAAKAAAGG